MRAAAEPGARAARAGRQARRMGAATPCMPCGAPPLAAIGCEAGARAPHAAPRRACRGGRPAPRPRAGARRAQRTVHAAVAPDARERLRAAARPRRAAVQPRLVVRVGQHRAVQRRQHLRARCPKLPWAGLVAGLRAPDPGTLCRLPDPAPRWLKHWPLLAGHTLRLGPACQDGRCCR
jgi:hypothetical protein